LLAVSISSLLLQAQCPQRGAASPPLGEVLKSLATACSHASLSDASCPVNHQATETTAYAMFKDCADTKPDAYLVVPTAPVTGVEDTKLRSDAYSRLLADAWEWGKRFPKADAAWTGLAINSACARDIDQLHVHVSCVSHAVKEALEKERESIPLYKDGEHPESREITVAMSNPSGTDSGQARYFAVRVTDLGKQNPVAIADKLTRHATPAACVQNPKRGEVVKEDVAVVGSPVQDEYFVLTYASGFGEGGAEDLLDQTCKQAEHKGGRN
jgi:CDP-diacylglycerol pyrophosphatase